MQKAAPLHRDFKPFDVEHDVDARAHLRRVADEIEVRPQLQGESVLGAATARKRPLPDGRGEEVRPVPPTARRAL